MSEEVGSLTFAQREAVAAHRGEIDELLEQLDARADAIGPASHAAIDKQLRLLRDDLQPADRIDLARAVQQCSRVRSACDRYLEKEIDGDRIVSMIQSRTLVYRIVGSVDLLRGDIEALDESVDEPA